MSEVAVSSGQWVEKGQIIGYVGNTGYSFGNHLHFEIYQDGSRVDPGQFV
jgi:murein DD-endopeptidase MepM/ murein hydrolase activator NlpD